VTDAGGERMPTPGRFVRPREMAVSVSAAILVASMLYQRPLVELEGGAGSVLVRPWDLAWLLFAVCSLPVAIHGLRAGRVALPARRSPLTPFLWLGALSLLSLGWELATFGTAAFGSAIIRALRVAATGYLAWILTLVWTPALARRLVVTMVIVAAVAGAMAVYASMFGTEAGTGLGVTRPGGPFGNFYASGNPDRWWAFPAASAGLGFWLAVALIVLAATCVNGIVHRRERLRDAVVSLFALVPVVAGLAVSHSRESWIAALVGGALVLTALRHSLPRWALRAAPVVAAIAILGLVAAIPTLNTRVLDSLTPGTFSFQTGPQARFQAWGDALQIGFERLPIGWGVGGVEEHPALFGRATGENVFLQTFMQTGLVGVALLILTVVFAVRAAQRRLDLAPEDIGGLFALATMCVLVVHGTFGNTLGDPSVQIVFGCAVGAVAGSRLDAARR
jgi:O-antigen ligase